MNRVTLRLALDFGHAAASDKASWTQRLVTATEARVPRDLEIESYDVSEKQIYIRLRSDMNRGRLRRLLREDDSLMRLRAYLADMGARSEFEFDDEEGR